MPTNSDFGVFDLTFDPTFRGVLLTPATPIEAGCRASGIYLGWLSPTGWMYWLFEGPIEVSKAVSSRGRKRQAGLTQPIQKEAALQLTGRTSNVTQEQAEAIATVYESVAVYVIAPDADDKFHAVPVDIEDGSYPVYTSRTAVHSLSVSITLPARRSARA